MVWYDSASEFAPFVGELRGGPRIGSAPVPISVGSEAVQLLEFDGSMFELRFAAEPFVAGDRPAAIVLYLPGCARESGSVLCELEKAGTRWEPGLRHLARELLQERTTVGVVDDLLSPDRDLGYADLTRLAAEQGQQAVSVLSTLFPVRGDDDVLAAWIASDERDADIVAKAATGELLALVRSTIGLDLVADSRSRSSAPSRCATCSRASSAPTCPARPPSLDSSGTADERTRSRPCARSRGACAPTMPMPTRRSRTSVEEELGLREAKMPAGALGSIDTFRFEERALLRPLRRPDRGRHVRRGARARRATRAELLARPRRRAEGPVGGAGGWRSWAGRDEVRDAVGRRSERHRTRLGRALHGEGSAGIASTRPSAAWRRGSRTSTRSRRSARSASCGAPTRTRARRWPRLHQGAREGAAGPCQASLHQTRVFSEVVRRQPEAGRLLPRRRDALRDGRRARGAAAEDVRGRGSRRRSPRCRASRPSAWRRCSPGASASFAVVEQGGKLGAASRRFLPDLAARKKFAAARIPKLVDMALDELLSLQPSKLATRRSTARRWSSSAPRRSTTPGEAGFTFQARQVMDTVIDDLARAIRKLAAAGVEHAVVSADHGHLFSAADRDESMRTDAPGGDTVELHRRCWIGRGGATPAGLRPRRGRRARLRLGPRLRVPAGLRRLQGRRRPRVPPRRPVASGAGHPRRHRADQVAPAGSAAGGPGRRVRRCPTRSPTASSASTLDARRPNLACSARRRAGPAAADAGGKQVGAVGMAVGAELDRATGLRARSSRTSRSRSRSC